MQLATLKFKITYKMTVTHITPEERRTRAVNSDQILYQRTEETRHLECNKLSTLYLNDNVRKTHLF